jgi:hypothetical protein
MLQAHEIDTLIDMLKDKTVKLTQSELKGIVQQLLHAGQTPISLMEATGRSLSWIEARQ